MKKKPEKQTFKMAELVKRTGVKKVTIHFYISEGLLPKPRKTEKNVAFYDESYVERIRQIKELQFKYLLPLKIIKEIVAQSDAEMSEAEMNLLRVGALALLKSLDRRQRYRPLTMDELSSKTGLPEVEILEMEKCEIISSVKDEQGRRVYHEYDIKVVEAFAEIRRGGMTRELGFKVDQFRMQSDVISTLAKEEVKDFVRKLSVQYKSNYDIENIVRLSENAIDSVNLFIAALRRKKILEFTQELYLRAHNAAKKSNGNIVKRRGREILAWHQTREVIENGAKKAQAKKNRHRSIA